VQFTEWEPIYLEIVREFGFSRQKDEESAAILDSLLAGKEECDDICLERIVGWEATVCGDGPNLDSDLDALSPRGTLISADGATSTLMHRRLWPDIIVTDLDGEVEPQLMANGSGAVVVVLAHGDNTAKVKEIVPRFRGPIVGTTQSTPFDGRRNYGGFTDGDRAVELARHFGARRVNLLGFDFENPRRAEGKDLERKRRKLKWARKIIFERNPIQVFLWTP
jgi:hypothetical protein